jgi:hypothetical protein
MDSDRGPGAASASSYRAVVIGATGASARPPSGPPDAPSPSARYGLQDRIAQALVPIVAPLLPKRYHQIRVEDLARAMPANAERPGPAGMEVLEYGAFQL